MSSCSINWTLSLQIILSLVKIVKNASRLCYSEFQLSLYFFAWRSHFASAWPVSAFCKAPLHFVMFHDDDTDQAQWPIPHPPKHLSNIRSSTHEQACPFSAKRLCAQILLKLMELTLTFWVEIVFLIHNRRPSFEKKKYTSRQCGIWVKCAFHFAKQWMT